MAHNFTNLIDYNETTTGPNWGERLPLLLLFILLSLFSEGSLYAELDPDPPNAAAIGYDVHVPETAGAPVRAGVRGIVVQIPSRGALDQVINALPRRPPAEPPPLITILTADNPTDRSQAEQLRKQLNQKSLPAAVILAPPNAPQMFQADQARATRITAGVISGSWRGVTSLTFFAVGLNPVYAAGIWTFATLRTTLRDIHINKVDGFYKGLYDRLFPSSSRASPDSSVSHISDPIRISPRSQKSGKRDETSLKRKTWGEWWEGSKRRVFDIAGRQTENWIALEVIRILATLGGGDPAKSAFTSGGQADILLNVAGPGMTGTYLSARRSHANLTETAKVWWNFNPTLIGNIFQALIWSGAGGPDVLHWQTFHVTTALAINMLHDFLLGVAIQRYPEFFNRIAQWQDRGFKWMQTRLKPITNGVIRLKKDIASSVYKVASVVACRGVFGRLLQ